MCCSYFAVRKASEVKFACRGSIFGTLWSENRASFPTNKLSQKHSFWDYSVIAPSNGYPIISRSGHWMPELVQCLDSGGTGRRATLGCLVMLSQGINTTMSSKFCKSHHFFPDQRWFFMTWKTLKNHLWYHTWFIKRRHVWSCLLQSYDIHDLTMVGEIIPKQAGQIWSLPKLSGLTPIAGWFISWNILF